MAGIFQAKQNPTPSMISLTPDTNTVEMPAPAVAAEAVSITVEVTPSPPIRWGRYPVYVVFCGRRRGFVYDLTLFHSFTDGYPGNVGKGFSTLERAKVAWKEFWCRDDIPTEHFYTHDLVGHAQPPAYLEQGDVPLAPPEYIVSSHPPPVMPVVPTDPGRIVVHIPRATPAELHAAVEEVNRSGGLSATTSSSAAVASTPARANVVPGYVVLLGKAPGVYKNRAEAIFALGVSDCAIITVFRDLDDAQKYFTQEFRNNNVDFIY
ncbi:hypothetical protein BD410DRAFT_846731 [Rickenella mellea]|uniref:Uncharacterized protein n=1 Tax=Rickenella mellea TaxID=50990 RepID=A0A4Y7PGA3_9AGAM|nr:hypothetical protein BD410DRAFT_846846 [Rickenella mellea]TDL13657.1 hypothetical protein BD410DRAFT_846731 [Rickenella mellea]